MKAYFPDSSIWSAKIFRTKRADTFLAIYKKVRNLLSRHKKLDNHLSWHMKMYDHISCICNETVWTIFQLVRHYWNQPNHTKNCPDRNKWKPFDKTVQKVLKLSGPSWKRPDRKKPSGHVETDRIKIVRWELKTIRTELKPSGQYWNCPDSIETLRTVLNPLRQYKLCCPNCIETLRTLLDAGGGASFESRLILFEQFFSLQPHISPRLREAIL